MITEDYVSFETAKLLKEKGFDGIVINSYDDYTLEFLPHCAKHYGQTNAPTLQMAMKWLREEHNLCIEPYRTACGYLSTISKIPTGSTLYSQEYEGDDENSGQFTTYEKSCETAIKYCLENLI